MTWTRDQRWKHCASKTSKDVLEFPVPLRYCQLVPACCPFQMHQSEKLNLTARNAGFGSHTFTSSILGWRRGGQTGGSGGSGSAYHTQPDQRGVAGWCPHCPVPKRREPWLAFPSCTKYIHYTVPCMTRVLWEERCAPSVESFSRLEATPSGNSTTHGATQQLAVMLVLVHIHTGRTSRAKPGELRAIAVLWNHNSWAKDIVPYPRRPIPMQNKREAKARGIRRLGGSLFQEVSAPSHCFDPTRRPAGCWFKVKLMESFLPPLGGPNAYNGRAGAAR